MAKKAAKKKKGTLEFGCPSACLIVKEKNGPGRKALEFGFPIIISTKDGKSITIDDGDDPAARRKKR